MEGDFIEDFLGYLNLIHHISANENAKDTQKMIQYIVNHIKYKFIRKDEIVMLKEELLQIDNLIWIFKARFGTNLQVTNNIKDEYYSFYIPNYIIVAFVENALFHGLIPKDGEWKITLELEENELDFKIQVMDNGIGFNTGILNLNGNTLLHSNDKIGTIPDIIARIQTFHGNDGHVDVFSSYEMGTRVEITIPKM